MSDNLPASRKRKGRGGPSDLQDAWQLLAGAAPTAVKTLKFISKHGQSEPARVTASKTILEMTGFGSRDVVPVQIVPSQFDPTGGPTRDGRISASQIVKERMAQLRASEAPESPQADEFGVEIVDAELVDPAE